MRLLRKPRVVIVLVVGLVIIGTVLGIWLHHGHNTTNTGKSKGTSSPTTAVIEITPSGFLPSTIAVSPNTNVVWVNEDVMPHLPAADPYPTHAELPALVASRALGQKETYTFLFTKKETVHYHDDLSPTMTGTVEVR